MSTAPPKTYRIYCFDVVQKVVTADFLKAAHDEEAIASAQQAYRATKYEIWDGRRLVAQIESERQQA